MSRPAPTRPQAGDVVLVPRFIVEAGRIIGQMHRVRATVIRSGSKWTIVRFGDGTRGKVENERVEYPDAPAAFDFPEIIIDVWNTRAAVSRRVNRADGAFSYEPAANWRALEPLAIQAVGEQGGGITQSGHYRCPDELAMLALWADDVLALVTTPAELEEQYGVTASAVRKAAERGDVAHRRAGTTWLIFKPAAIDKWAR